MQMARLHLKCLLSNPRQQIKQALATFAAIFLILGFWTRSAAILLHFWHLAYSYPGYPMSNGGDCIARAVGFLLIFCPLGEVWSMDARRRGPDAAPMSRLVPVYGLRLVQWQMMIMYVDTVWLKVADSFWRQGAVLPYFHISNFARTPILFFVFHEKIGTVLTFSTLVIELSLPFLLWNRKSRLLGVILGIGLHAGIAFASPLIVFSLLALSTYAAFLEGGDIEAVGRLLRPRRSSVAS